MLDGNKKNQTAGDNALQMQVDGDLIVGVTAAEARQIALDVFKANFFDLSIEAKQKAEERVAEITDKVIERLYSETPDKVQKIQDPDIQYSLFNVQKEYARIGDAELGENLILALIDKIKIDDRNSESFIIDDALQILSKLSKPHLAFLGMMVFSKIGIPVNGREHFKHILLKLSLILKEMAKISSLDMAYLKQSGCVYGTTNIGVNSSLEKHMEEEYGYYYLDLIDMRKFEELLLKHTQGEIEKQVKLRPVFDNHGSQILGLKFSNQNRYKEAVANFPLVFQDFVKNFCDEYISLQGDVTNEIIQRFHNSIDSNWGAVFTTMNSQQVKSFNLNPVGLYIGSIYLSKIIEMKIPLEIFYTNN